MDSTLSTGLCLFLCQLSSSTRPRGHLYLPSGMYQRWEAVECYGIEAEVGKVQNEEMSEQKRKK